MLITLRKLALTASVLGSLLGSGCVSRPAGTDDSRPPSPGNERPETVRWFAVEDFSRKLAVFDTVFWEPRDTVSLRELIRETPLVGGKKVLEIGTGSGLLALCILKHGAEEVVATDVNPNAVRNAAFNAKLFELDDRLEVRLVPLSQTEAFSVIRPSERFDLIISNPPWELGPPRSIEEFAYFDRDFQLLRSCLSGLKDHLRPGGKALLAYGCVDAIRNLERIAADLDLTVTALDERDLRALPAKFLPGMLFEVKP